MEDTTNNTNVTLRSETEITSANKDAAAAVIDHKPIDESQRLGGERPVQQPPEEPVPLASTSTAHRVANWVESSKKSVAEPIPPSSADSQATSKLSCTSSNLLKQVLMKNAFTGSRDSRLPKVEIFAPNEGPRWFDVQSRMVTQRLVPEKLPEAFAYLPVHGSPEGNETLQQFHDKKIREFIGCDLNDQEYEKLSSICSTEHLKTGRELSMPSTVPSQILVSTDIKAILQYSELHKAKPELCSVKKNRFNKSSITNQSFVKKLKYRGLRMIPLAHQKLESPKAGLAPSELLVPGTDLLYHLRMYRPFFYNMNSKSWSHSLAPCRHSVLSRDAILTGRSPLKALREYLCCANDADARHDVSAMPDQSITSAKDLFPSGFFFINNVFYVDESPGHKDLSAVIRQWAVKRGLGVFPKRPMTELMKDVTVRLGHPEVYVHQGNCEHLFTISDVRLVSAADPLNLSHYPCHTSTSLHHSVYCTACAEFSAKWIVVGCRKVPFDPAFFCDNCLKQYLYKDGEKVCEFRVYSYKGNEINNLSLKPHA